MILADTSVWIDHLADADPALDALLRQRRIVCHPFVVGELACGTFPDRKEILHLLRELPHLEQAPNEEVMSLNEHNRLMGAEIGWIDMHLLASVRISHDELWTRDKRLAAAAARINVRTVSE